MRGADASEKVLTELARLNRLITDAVSNVAPPTPPSRSEDRLPADLIAIGGRGLVSDEMRSRAASAAKAYLKVRRARENLFPCELFGEAAWDILLDLYVNEVKGKSVSISDACIASGVAPTTALRWISKLIEADLIIRSDDPHDRRKSYLRLVGDTDSRVERWIFAAFPECKGDSRTIACDDTARHDRIYSRAP